MPIAIGLLSTQQESFEHHEELSKLSNESEVFYVPFQNDFQNNQDLSNLTKRFDEDISNRHLVVVSQQNFIINFRTKDGRFLDISRYWLFTFS